MPCGKFVDELARSWVSLQVFIQRVQGEELPEVQLADTAGNPCCTSICDAQSWVNTCCYNAAEGLLLFFCACKICSLGEKETPKSSHAPLRGCCLGHFDCSKGERGPTKTKNIERMGLVYSLFFSSFSKPLNHWLLVVPWLLHLEFTKRLWIWSYSTVYLHNLVLHYVNKPFFNLSLTANHFMKCPLFSHWKNKQLILSSPYHSCGITIFIFQAQNTLSC